LISPMKHISILCLKEDREKLIFNLQRQGGLMLIETKDTKRNPSAAADKLRRVSKLRENLKPFTPKKGFLDELPEVSKERLLEVSTDDLNEAGEFEALLEEVAAKKEELTRVRDTLSLLLPWKNLTLPIEEIKDTPYTSLHMGRVISKKVEDFSKAVANRGGAAEVVSDNQQAAFVAAALPAGEDNMFFAEYGFDPAELPDIKGVAADIIKELKRDAYYLDHKIKALENTISRLSSASGAASLLHEQFTAEMARETAPFAETKETSLLMAWVPPEGVDEVKKVIYSSVSACDISVRDPLPDEEPPTLLKTNKVVKQFEGITNMFSVPAYGGIDPNPVMAPWYWIIFGLMMGDAGYGLMMAVLGLSLKLILKPKGAFKQILNIIIFSSVTSIAAGAAFGSYFGETWRPLFLSPVEEPTKMLIFTMVVGAAHIITGLIVKIVINIKNGGFWDAVFDQFSWILIITGLGLVFLPDFKLAGIIIASVGGVIVLFTGGRAKKNIFGKITGGLLALYGVSGYFSDILSYSRILALGLATGIVGMVMNMLARMVSGSWYGFIGAILIYIVGHVFNLALGLLSAYVHACRLQYIEFYGKFYEGNGRLFEPFALKPKLINLKQYGGN